MNTITHPYKRSGISGVKTLASRFSKTFLCDLYYKMLRIRLIEEEIANQYHKDQMKTPIHLVIGQEAMTVGSCAVLKQQELVFCTHRTHGVYLAKGGDLKAMMSELYCRANGCAGSRGGSMHLLDKEAGLVGGSAIVGGAIPIATGAALTAQLTHKDYLTTVYFGDAATEEGVLWESLNFAVLKKLPIIYFCENNYYSVCSPIENRQPPRIKIYKKAESFGARSESVDGCNVLAVYEAMWGAVQHIQSNQGPCFIEAHAYRWRGHHGAKEDSDGDYRSAEELQNWKQYDPVGLLKQVLLEEFGVTSEQFAQMQEKIIKEIQDAFNHAEKSENPQWSDLLKHVYSS